MKVLLIPLIVILLPITILYFMTKYWLYHIQLTKAVKLCVSGFFIIIGVLASFYATMPSIQGFQYANVKCIMGVSVFVPLGSVLHIIGVPKLLSNSNSSNKRKSKFSNILT